MRKRSHQWDREKTAVTEQNVVWEQVPDPPGVHHPCRQERCPAAVLGTAGPASWTDTTLRWTSGCCSPATPSTWSWAPASSPASSCPTSWSSGSSCRRPARTSCATTPVCPTRAWRSCWSGRWKPVTMASRCWGTKAPTTGTSRRRFFLPAPCWPQQVRPGLRWGGLSMGSFLQKSLKSLTLTKVVSSKKSWLYVYNSSNFTLFDLYIFNHYSNHVCVIYI